MNRLNNVGPETEVPEPTEGKGEEQLGSETSLSLSSALSCAQIAKNSHTHTRTNATVHTEHSALPDRGQRNEKQKNTSERTLKDK